jgi:hypothetical protein
MDRSDDASPERRVHPFADALKSRRAQPAGSPNSGELLALPSDPLAEHMERCVDPTCEVCN